MKVQKDLLTNIFLNIQIKIEGLNTKIIVEPRFGAISRVIWNTFFKNHFCKISWDDGVFHTFMFQAKILENKL